MQLGSLRKIHGQCGVLGMDLLKCYSSYLYLLLNSSQAEEFLSFLLKTNFSAAFSRLLLLSRLVKWILCSRLWEFLNVLLFTKMPSCYLSLSFSRQAGVSLSMNWLLTPSGQETNSNKKLFCLLSNTSTIACQAKLIPFSDQGKLVLSYNQIPLPPQKSISLTYFCCLVWFVFFLSNKMFTFSPNTQLCLSELNHQKKGAGASMWWSAQTQRFVTVPCLEQHSHKLFRNTQHQYSE